jgi:26S proteasome non-ATPase regulatory subunit 10
LVELGVPFTRTAVGYSALHVAAMNGHVNSTSFLLEYILPDEKDNFGRTSLMGATRGGYPDVVDVLVRGGASLDMQDNSGVTALAHTARFDDLLHVAERLIAAGASLAVTDEIGFTPLHAACRSGTHRNALAFYRAGGDIFAMDISGWTPLNHAMKMQHDDIVHDIVSIEMEVPLIPAPTGPQLHRQRSGVEFYGFDAGMLMLGVGIALFVSFLIPLLYWGRRKILVETTFKTSQVRKYKTKTKKTERRVDEKQVKEFVSVIVDEALSAVEHEERQRTRRHLDTFNHLPVNSKTLRDLHRRREQLS